MKTIADRTDQEAKKWPRHRLSVSNQFGNNFFPHSFKKEKVRSNLNSFPLQEWV